MKEMPPCLASAQFAARLIFTLIASSFTGEGVFAQDSTPPNTPYIDSLKQKMRSQGQSDHDIDRSSENPEPYIDSLKRKMSEPKGGGQNPTPENPQPFIDRLKSQNPSLNQPSAGSGYTDQQKSTLAPKDLGGAITAVNENRSELSMKRPGESQNTFGFKIGTFAKRTVSASSDVQLAAFSSVYGNGVEPDFNIYAEHFLIHVENGLSFGIMAYVGILYWGGYGNYAIQLLHPISGTPFPLQSQTKFTFLSVPAGVGPSFRLNLLPWFSPYAQLMPTIDPFFETRNDGLSGHHGYSLGLEYNAGVAIQLDWISKDTTWALYRDYSIKHVYFTAEYAGLSTPLKSVDFQLSALSMGFMFDF